MKKRVFAVLLAFCMIAATCVLFASADGDITFTKNSYVQNGDDADPIIWGSTTLGDLQDSQQIKATIKPKTSNAKLPASLADHPSRFDYEALKKIADVNTGNVHFFQAYQISSVTFTVGPDRKTATVKVTVSVTSDASDDRVYQVGSSDISGNVFDILNSSDFTSWSGMSKYRINGKNSDTITIYGVELIEEQQPDPPVLDKTSVSLIYKESEVLKSSEPVVWSSSNDKVAKIDKVDDKTGVLTITGEGVATITATTQDGRTATCVVMAKYAWWQVLIRIFLLGFLWY